MNVSGAKIYVGNLSWNTNDETLRNVFSQYGNVLDSIVMRDRETGRSRGFGFVTYGTEGEAQHAIGTASGMELDGRVIKVNLANARGSGGGPGGPGAMFQPQPFPAAPMGGFNAFPGGYGGAPPAAPYGAFGGYQPPSANPGGFANFNPQAPGYGAPPTQFPPSQGANPYGGY